MKYSEQFWDHFLHPRNVGTMQDADGVGTVGDPACGDFLKIWIKVENDHISKITFKCKGCPAAIATSSIMTEIAQGKHVDQAAQITDETILEAIGGRSKGDVRCCPGGSVRPGGLGRVGSAVRQVLQGCVSVFRQDGRL